MNLIPQVLAMVLTQFSIGTLLMTTLLPPREIRLGFFTLNSLLGALTAGIALVLVKLHGETWWNVRYLGLTVIGATAAYGAFKLEKLEVARILLLVSALLGLFFGLLPMVGNTIVPMGSGVPELRVINTTARGYFEAGAVAGALLLGASSVSMILGHWYLLMRRLSFEYLLRFTQILLVAVGLRALVLFMTVSLLTRADPTLGGYIQNLWVLSGNLLFFLLRLACGIALPAALGVAALRCVNEKSNQAATGMLYVVEVTVLFGELLAAYLLI